MGPRRTNATAKPGRQLRESRPLSSRAALANDVNIPATIQKSDDERHDESLRKLRELGHQNRDSHLYPGASSLAMRWRMRTGASALADNEAVREGSGERIVTAPQVEPRKLLARNDLPTEAHPIVEGDAGVDVVSSALSPSTSFQQKHPEPTCIHLG